MSELTNRLKRARAHTGLNQTDFARQVGLSMRGYQAQERAIARPSFAVLEKFAELGINANWLLTGEGEMLLNDTGEGKFKALRQEVVRVLARIKIGKIQTKKEVYGELYKALYDKRPTEELPADETPNAEQPNETSLLETQVNANKKKIDTLWECARATNTQIECLLKLNNRTRQPLIKRVWDWVFGNNVEA